MVQLELLDEDGRTTTVRPVSTAPLYLGRGPTNDLVLADETVSARHASVWALSGEIWLEDLGSRNGTFVNGERVTGTRQLRPGDRIVLGTGVTFRLIGVLPPTPRPDALVPLVEHIQTGLRYPFRDDRFTIGPDAADLIVPTAPEDAVLLAHEDGQVQLGLGDELLDLAVDKPFEVYGQRLCIRAVPPTVTRTHEVEATRCPYRIRASLDGPTGPEAVIEDPTSGREHRLKAENRAVLLYLLARQYGRDAGQGKASSERGWVYDVELVQQIWGFAQAESRINNLHVLLSRTRRELKKAGFDPWFLESRQRHVRVRIAEASSDPA